MNPTILGQNNCGNCAHHGAQNGQMVCQFNPPTAHPVIAYVEITTMPKGISGPESRAYEPQPRGFISAWPPVAPDAKCSHYNREIMRRGIAGCTLDLKATTPQ